MKNHELLDLIGEANEDYVQAADGKVLRPRFRWKALAACAACAALVLGAYPVYRAAHPTLHDYTVMEGGTMNTLEDVKAPAGGEIDIPGQNPPVPNPEDPPRGDGPVPGGAYVGDAPADEAASDQYDKLLKGMGMHGENAADSYPDWFAGAWISQGTLNVALVGEERNVELEEQIRGWCGDGVVFEYAKYSHAYLDGLMEPVATLLDGTGLNCGIGVDVTANCLGVDLYSDGQTIPDSILAQLAKLDPTGDAIRVRLFTGKLDALTDDIMKCPPEPVAPEERATPATTVDGVQPEPTPIPVEDGKIYHGEDAPADAVPGGVAKPGSHAPGAEETAQPAHYDLLPLGE